MLPTEYWPELAPLYKIRLSHLLRSYIESIISDCRCVASDVNNDGYEEPGMYAS